MKWTDIAVKSVVMIGLPEKKVFRWSARDARAGLGMFQRKKKGKMIFDTCSYTNFREFRISFLVKGFVI